ncbi:hypothetical protein LAZ67_3003775, partial [Cordylochernes scorpioides]
MDQRTCIKFCVKNEIKCADAFRMLTVAYGEATLDRSNVYRWYKMFLEGREDVNEEERAGRPSTSTTDEKINEVEKMILANRRITVREVAEDLNISIGSGVVHHDFLPQGRTVNEEYYLQVMRNLREAIRQKRPDLWNNKIDLAPCDFFLFPKLKRPMKGRRYATLDEIKTASKEEPKKIFKNDFLKCFEDRKNRWHKCIISHGDYFEGDKIEKLHNIVLDDWQVEVREIAEAVRILEGVRNILHEGIRDVKAPCEGTMASCLILVKELSKSDKHHTVRMCKPSQCHLTSQLTFDPAE